MRINKFLAHAGIASRRKVDTLIEEGKIKINGKTAKLGQQVNPQTDKITANGKPIANEQENQYFILNKPVGVTSTVSDKHAAKTVLDYVRTNARIYPVGRLDQNSKGLIILTNDGDLANRLTHPRYHVPKVYHVMYKGNVGKDKIGRIEKGIELEEGKTKEAKVKTLTSDEGKTILEITLFEGRKRQIRRMAEKLHLFILSLKRTEIGPITLGNLKSGEYKKLTAQEVSSLKKQAGLY